MLSYIFIVLGGEHEKHGAVVIYAAITDTFPLLCSSIENPGYHLAEFILHLVIQNTQAIGYIQQGYELFTFNMVHAPHPDNPDIAVIKDFERRLEHRYLRKEGTVWYADFSANTFPDELPVAGDYIEGAKKNHRGQCL